MNVVAVGEWTASWRLKQAEGSLASVSVTVPHLCHGPVCDKADWLGQHAPPSLLLHSGARYCAYRLLREWEQPWRRCTAFGGSP